MFLKRWIAVTVGIVAFAGCDKGKTDAAAPTPQSTTPGSAAPTVSAAAAVKDEAFAGAYHNVTDNAPAQGERRDQVLTLAGDGSATLHTTVTAIKGGTVKGEDTATGTFKVTGKQVVATFTVKDGKPIPASDTKHVMTLTKNSVGRGLTESDGRLFKPE